MHRLAVLSDIHGNGRALQAVLSDIGDRGIDRIINLGDCLYGPFDPRPVADRLLELSWPTVAGNEDRCLSEAAGPEFTNTARFTYERLAARHLDWLAELPGRLDIAPGILAIHGSPTSDRQYLLHRPDGVRDMRPAADDEIQDLVGDVAEQIILCGHDHLPRVARLRDGRTIANPGSVGCPAYTDDHPIPHVVENGSPHARYAILTLDTKGVSVESILVDYDWDAAANEAESNGFPDWSKWIRSGSAG